MDAGAFRIGEALEVRVRTWNVKWVKHPMKIRGFDLKRFIAIFCNGGNRVCDAGPGWERQIQLNTNTFLHY